MIPGYISVFRAQETKTYFELRNYEAARKMGGGEEVADQNVTYIEKKKPRKLIGQSNNDTSREKMAAFFHLVRHRLIPA